MLLHSVIIDRTQIAYLFFVNYGKEVRDHFFHKIFGSFVWRFA